MLNTAFGDTSLKWPARARIKMGDADLSVACVQLGVDGEFGVVVVGSERLVFPEQTEQLLLEVAANQACLGLQQARLMSEQRRVARELETDFPRNRLFTLEVGSSALRAGQFAEADVVLTRGLAAFDRDPRPKLAGERALWLYKRGASRVRMNRLDEARVDLDTALAQSPPTWVRGRILMELGKIADLGGKRADALAAYKQARAVAVSVEDSIGIAAIDQWVRRPYTLPASVVGIDNDVSDLLTMANQQLRGAGAGPTISEVNSAVNTINLAFDGCRQVVPCE